MGEELVQNIVMDEELVQNFVMGAKIDPKVEMDLAMFEIDGWKILQLNNQKMLEGFFEEAATVARILSFSAKIHSSRCTM